MSCTLAQMNKFILYWHHEDVAFFEHLKFFFYALGKFFSQDHLISETVFVCSHLNRKGKDEKLK